ncbi:MAG TPA: hypothetical protein VFZ25_13665 [Chloroflexota bacterium]|nr:hypothetical protein [Chloroflexota bacterium]
MADSPTNRSGATASRCARCHALLAPGDRFCAVCGSTRRLAETGSRRGRGVRLVVVSAVVLLAVFAAVAWIYFSAPERRQAHAIARITDPPPLSLALAPGDGSLVLLGSASGPQVSTDAGDNWQFVGSGAKGEIAAAAPSGSALYLANPGLFRGDGRAWQPVATDLPTDSIRGLAVDPRDPNRLYAVVSGHGFYRSDDAGARWTLLGNAIPTDADGLAIGPGNLFYLATAGHGVFASQEGQAWSNASGFVNGALPTPNIRAIAFDPRSGDSYAGPNGEHLTGALYVATDRGLFKSIDGGSSWSALPLPEPLVALAVDASHRMIAIGADGSVYRSNDGGVSWD